MLAMTLLVSACQSYVQEQRAERQVNVEQDRLRLMVYTSDLTEPYEKLGQLSYTDPLNGETIASDHINEKLRQMAIDRWGQQVDAVILVTTKVGAADASTISVHRRGGQDEKAMLGLPAQFGCAAAMTKNGRPAAHG